MSKNVTHILGLGDHINDVRLRTARIVNDRALTNESLVSGARQGDGSVQVPSHIAKNVLRHYDKNEGWDFGE